MKAAMALPSRRSPRARSEAGFALIEVVISAAVLAIVALAVLSGVDGAQSSTGREKARSVAASLAEQDQERLRSTPVQTLATSAGAAATPGPVTVDGAQYIVTSTVAWVRDDTGGTASCASDTRDSDYLHVTSTVTSAYVGTRVAPVQIDSIVAPNIEYSTTHGSLGVKVVDASGNPLTNKMVTITGPGAGGTTSTGQTNSVGCAYFQKILAGSYTIGLNTLGLVDHFGVTNLNLTNFNVAPGVLNLVSVQYDNPATANVSVKTYPPGAAATAANQIPSAATRVSTVNSADVSLLRNYPVTGPVAPTAAFAADKLFPFAGSNYTFFTGTCLYSNPTFYKNTDGKHPNNATYFSNYAGALIATAGNTFNVNVLQPPLNFRLTGHLYNSLTATDMSGLTITASPDQPGGQSCVEPDITGLKWFSNAPATNGNIGRSINSTTQVIDAGMPYGTYTLCFTDTAQSPDRYYSTTYDNSTAPNGGAVTSKVMTTADWVTASC
jgi:type II secretory pathway pseudopilin PulG